MRPRTQDKVRRPLPVIVLPNGLGEQRNVVSPESELRFGWDDAEIGGHLVSISCHLDTAVLKASQADLREWP
jgi:hypothetical protein